MKGTIFTQFFSGRTRLQRLATIRWLFVRGKGTRFKVWATYPDSRFKQVI